MADAAEGLPVVADHLRPLRQVEQARLLGDRVGRTERSASKKKQRSPSYCIIDSQSAKTQYVSEARGIDGGKQVKGRKRHIVVDVLGCLLHVQVHAANVHDKVGGCEVMRRAQNRHPGLKAFSGPAHLREDPGWLRRPAQTLGGRASLRLVRRLPPPIQGL